MTDEARNYTVSKVFKAACDRHQIRHLTTGPYRPRINGKVERFNRTLDDIEYATLEWVDWFNHRRVLEPIGDIPPAELEAAYHQRRESHVHGEELNESSLR